MLIIPSHIALFIYGYIGLACLSLALLLPEACKHKLGLASFVLFLFLFPVVWVGLFIEAWWLSLILAGLLFLLLLALWKFATESSKWGWSILVIVLFALPMTYAVQQGWLFQQELAARKRQSDRAEAMFKEHCKKAGFKIYKTAENVEGIFLMKLRPRNTNFESQFTFDDQYGDDYMRSFLIGRNAGGRLAWDIAGPEVTSPGYRYVELFHPETGERVRYEGRMLSYLDRSKRRAWDMASCPPAVPAEEKNKDLASCPVAVGDQLPRYGVTFDDISTQEDLEHWIAGSSLRVIDLVTGEVMGERIRYMMIDLSQGYRQSGYSPWREAPRYACPSFEEVSSQGNSTRGQTRDFVEQVLKPKPLD